MKDRRKQAESFTGTSGILMASAFISFCLFYWAVL